MFLSVIHGIILMVACMAGMPHFLRLYTKDEAIIEMGLTYANRVFVFSVIIMLGISLEKIFQSVGRMKVSMMMTENTNTQDGDGGSRLRNRNRTDDHITCLCAILHLPSVAAVLQA